MNTYTHTANQTGNTHSTMQDAIFNAGLGYPDIIDDGKIHRFSAPDDKHGSKNCWYVSFGSGGKFGSWKLGFSEIWHDGSSSTDRAELSHQIKEAQQKRKDEIKRNRKLAQENARNLWDAGSEIINHPYPDNKLIKPYGARQKGQILLIPMFFDDRLVNVQRIFADGKKRFLKGGRVTGCYMRLGTITDHVFICEGFSTGCSLHEHTGTPVVVAFNAGNLEPVAKIIREKYPDAEITITADNDIHTEGNTGLTKARKAAATVGGDFIYPDFSDEEFDGTDYNDYLTQGGAM